MDRLGGQIVRTDPRLSAATGWRIAGLAALLAAWLCVPSPSPLLAQDVEYDQTYTPREVFAWWSARALGPVGQEFVPQVGRLDVVDLLVLNQDNTAPQPTSVFVRIHRDSLGGGLVATSETQTVPYLNELPVRFQFDPPVVAQVGSMYVIELVAATSAGNPSIAAGPDVDLYPPGHAIVEGIRLQKRDMWFRTGAHTVATHPSSWGEMKRRYRD
jgi:hypothetical protein